MHPRHWGLDLELGEASGNTVEVHSLLHTIVVPQYWSTGPAWIWGLGKAEVAQLDGYLLPGL